MEPGALRRALVFALIFGGALGLLAWLAGGFKAKSPGGGEPAPESPADPGAVAPIGGGLGLGESEDAVLRQDAVKVVGGRAVRYRPWTASWRRATPVASNDPDVGVQNVEQPKIVLFPEPTETSQGAVKEGAPGTTRIVSKLGVVAHQKDVRTTARLTGDVVLEHFDVSGDDVTLRTQLLDCTIESPADARGPTRHAQSTELVTVEGGRARIEGVGLDADLTGTATRVTLLANVKGRFVASGGFAASGGRPDGRQTPVEVTCSGACELVSLDTRSRASERRWRATFRDDVHVRQEGASLVCDLLEVEFRANAPREKGQLPADRIVATGHVSVLGAKDVRAYSISCDKATRTREGTVGSEVDVVVYEGSPVMTVEGLIGSARKTKPDPAEGANERLEIRCDDPVTMRSQRAGTQPSSPYRTSVEFRRNVVVRRWMDVRSGKVTSELRAPLVHLYGTRLDDERFQPDTMTAENGVEIVHDDGRAHFESHSGTATWTRLLDFGIDRFMLSLDPAVRYRGIAPVDAFGAGRTVEDGVFALSSKENVTIDVFDERPDPAGGPPRPYAKLTAGPQAKLVQYDADEELSRLTSAQLEAVIGKDRRLQHVQATGGAHAWGRGGDGRQRDVYGTSILLDETPPPPGADPKAARPAIVTAIGAAGSPAVAIAREADGRRHDIRADRLKYDESGALLTALGHVEANLSGRRRDEKPEEGRHEATPGSVKITAAEARIRFAPRSQESGERQELRTVTATGDVAIDGGTSRATGHEATYDAVAGVAELKGQGRSETAILKSTAESTRYPSLLTSNLIRVHFDTSDDPLTSGQIVRATSPGGGHVIRYFDPPDAAGATGANPPRQMQLQSAGPIEMTRTEATMTGDVAAQMKGLSPSGEWTITLATVYCERAHLTFDPPETKGAAKDRLRTLDATGADGRQVLSETPETRCWADRLDMDFRASTMRFSTLTEKHVYLRKLTPGGEQSTFESGTFHYLTNEWSDFERLSVVQESDRERR